MLRQRRSAAMRTAEASPVRASSGSDDVQASLGSVPTDAASSRNSGLPSQFQSAVEQLYVSTLGDGAARRRIASRRKRIERRASAHASSVASRTSTIPDSSSDEDDADDVNEDEEESMEPVEAEAGVGGNAKSLGRLPGKRDLRSRKPLQPPVVDIESSDDPEDVSSTASSRGERTEHAYKDATGRLGRAQALWDGLNDMQVSRSHIVVQALSSCKDRLQLLADLRPVFVIVYDPEPGLTRELELFKAQFARTKPVRVYFLTYDNSAE